MKKIVFLEHGENSTRIVEGQYLDLECQKWNHGTCNNVVRFEILINVVWGFVFKRTNFEKT